MQKKLLSLLLSFCTFIIIAEQVESKAEILKKDEMTVPIYLRDKRENDKLFIEAFIKQACKEDETAIDQNVYDKKVQLCYAPQMIGFITWLTRLFRWDSSSPSQLEIQIKNLDDWSYEKNKEISDLTQTYEQKILEVESITKEASEKLRKIFLGKQGDFKEIGRKVDKRPELLPDPNQKYLQKQADIIEEQILPKFARRFHNLDIAITQEEMAHIFCANLIYMQRKADLDEIIQAINSVVEQYEKQQENKKAQK
jgi:hypothetical protein